MKYPIGTKLVENTFNGWTSGFPVDVVTEKRKGVYTLRDSFGAESGYTELAIDQMFHLLNKHHQTAHRSPT